MPDTGFRTSGTIVSTGTWTNFTTTRIATADDSRASTVNTAFDPGVARNFGFTVPTNATIDGIEVNIELSPSNGAQIATARASLSHNAGTNYTAVSAEVSHTGNSTDQSKTMGGAADTWGRSWTPAEINDNANFYVKLEAKNSAGGAANTRVDILRVKVYYTLPKTATFSDNFNDNSLSASWDESLAGDASRINEQNGQIEITHPVGAQYNTLVTALPYDLTGSNFYVKVVDVGSLTQDSHEVQLMIFLDSNNKVWLMFNDGNLKAFKLVAGVQAQVGSNLAYSSTDHLYFRLSESGGTISFDTAPDGSTWTSRFTLANPFAITAIKMAMVVGNWQAEASESYGYFDDFNTAPSGVTTRRYSLSLSGVG